MSVSREMFELSSSEFEALVGREFAFLTQESGFPAPLFWEFADTLYASFENPELRTVTWCGKRDDTVWTYVDRLSIGHGIGLDTVNSILNSGLDYPPDTGSSWTRDEVEARIALEAAILRAHLPTLLASDVSIFEEYGGITKPDSLSLDDPVATFPRRCAERFGFLQRGYGFESELDGMGSTLLYRGDPVSVRISLLEESYEHEDEPVPTVSAEISQSPGGLVPPLFVDSEELEITDRTGPFSLTYLESAFDEVERELRRRMPSVGGHGG